MTIQDFSMDIADMTSLRKSLSFKVVTEQVTLKNMMFAPAYVSRRLLLVEFKVSKLSLLTPAMEASCQP